MGELYECQKCHTLFCKECRSESDRLCIFCKLDPLNKEDLEEDEEDWEEEYVEEFEYEEKDEIFEDKEDLKRLEHGLKALKREGHPPFSTFFPEFIISLARLSSIWVG